MSDQRPSTTETYKTEADWLAARRTGIGSTDAPAILGISAYASPLTVYHAKRGTVMPEREPPAPVPEWLYWGLALQPLIGARYADETHRQVTPAAPFSLVRWAEHPVLVASPDAYVTDPQRGRGLLELKNVGWPLGHEWIEAQEAPLQFQVQLQHQMMVTGCAWGAIAALIGGQRFVFQNVERDETFIARLADIELTFWRDYIERGIEPPADGTAATKELLRALYPQALTESVELPSDALDWHRALVETKDERQRLQTRQTELENRFRQVIGPASQGVHPSGLVYSLKTVHRKEYVAKATAYRQLRCQTEPNRGATL